MIANSVPCRNGLTIHPVNQDLEIHYTGLSFIRPDDVRFKYKMEGLDRNWVEAGTRRVAYYTHLPPGNYVFQVIAANSDGIWNTEGKRLEILTMSPFYRTWWFLTLALASMAGLILLAWNYRVSQLKRMHAVQQDFARRLISSQENERKRIAAELHDSLGQHLLVIKNWAALALSSPRNGDAAREPLAEISSAAADAIDYGPRCPNLRYQQLRADS